ncbi:MAG: hypothetical protein KGO96_03665 [Elusimicrobia bacterium]|nr:hypothetical protein [Elusimicrobiota bacterium]MDE2424990.1 hypothetical protein [Elusimicrobiota bacterium]
MSSAQSSLLEACARACRAPRLLRRRARLALRTLDRLPAPGRSQIQFSLKIAGDRPLPILRLWSLWHRVAPGPAQERRDAYLARLRGFSKLMGPATAGGGARSALKALELVGERPIDLFLSADFGVEESVYGLCLAFGGVREDGKAVFFPEADAVAREVLSEAGFARRKIARRGLLNLAFDIRRGALLCKTYRLAGPQAPLRGRQAQAARALTRRLRRHRPFVFFSDSHGAGGRRRKLFVELLDKPWTGEADALKRIVGAVVAAGGRLEARAAVLSLASCPALLACVGLEEDGTATFYLRPGGEA